MLARLLGKTGSRRHPAPRLSVVVISYDMPRELPRTLLSLSSEYQRGITREDYEIIVVDNGSPVPPSPGDIEAIGAQIRVIEMPCPCSPSPCRAINTGIAAARAPLIGVWIDGARIASAGILKSAMLAARIHQRAVIGTLGFHIGPEVQMKSVANGYDQHSEDALLDSINWPDEPDRLFDISVFAASSAKGWFEPISESNAVFMSKVLWDELGGYDEQFVSPGGGLVNLDTWRRACELPDSRVVMLLGEGTFHQVHGGIATNASQSPWRPFHDEYVCLRGKPFSAPRPETWFFGRVPRNALATLNGKRAERAPLIPAEKLAPRPATSRVSSDASDLD